MCGPRMQSPRQEISCALSRRTGASGAVARRGATGTRPVEHDGEIRFGEAVRFAERRLDTLEQLAIAASCVAAGLADVEVVDMAVQDVLIGLPALGQVERLDDAEPLERDQVPVYAGTIDPAHPVVDVLVDFAQAHAARLAVEDELQEHPTARSDSHAVGTEYCEQIAVPLHIA